MTELEAYRAFAYATYMAHLLDPPLYVHKHARKLWGNDWKDKVLDPISELTEQCFPKDAKGVYLQHKGKPKLNVYSIEYKGSVIKGTKKQAIVFAKLLGSYDILETYQQFIDIDGVTYWIDLDYLEDILKNPAIRRNAYTRITLKAFDPIKWVKTVLDAVTVDISSILGDLTIDNIKGLILVGAIPNPTNMIDITYTKLNKPDDYFNQPLFSNLERIKNFKKGIRNVQKKSESTE